MKAKLFITAMFIAVVSVHLSAQVGSADVASTSSFVPDEKPCRWWQRPHCQVESFPELAPRTGVVIGVDTTHNIAYLWKDGELLAMAPASTGMDTTLRRGLRQWLFRTPRGRHKVMRKIIDPVWVKPDWAFIEEGKPVPPPDSPDRKVKGYLGKYALDLGDRILIHGTKDTRLLGRKASHGCIRVGKEMLELMYEKADVGTEVHIF